MRGARARGKSYERKFGKYLARTLNHEVISGQWFQFQDSNGFGYAQPDHYVLQPDKIQLFECKLSQDQAAWAQMQDLYVPLLRMVYRMPVECVMVCRHLRNDRATLIHAYGEARNGVVWHWLDY